MLDMFVLHLLCSSMDFCCNFFSATEMGHERSTYAARVHVTTTTTVSEPLSVRIHGVLKNQQ